MTSFKRIYKESWYVSPNVTGARGEYVFGRTEEGQRYRKNHLQEEPRGPAGPETNLIRKGMAGIGGAFLWDFT